MGDYYWDSKIDYLSKTRGLYYNDDYLEFLVKSVWQITHLFESSILGVATDIWVPSSCH